MWFVIFIWKQCPGGLSKIVVFMTRIFFWKIEIFSYVNIFSVGENFFLVFLLIFESSDFFPFFSSYFSELFKAVTKKGRFPSGRTALIRHPQKLYNVIQETFLNRRSWVISHGPRLLIFWSKEYSFSFWIEWYTTRGIPGKLGGYISQYKIQTKTKLFLLVFKGRLYFPKAQKNWSFQLEEG